MEEKSAQKVHKVMLSNRRSGVLNGVVDVLSFDVGEILLMIKGSELHVSRLTLEKGEIDIEGRIDSLAYSDGGSASKQGESFLGRLFK